MFEIIEKEQLNNTITLMKIKAPLIAAKAKAGQFIVLRTDEKGERIPLTIADTDGQDAVTIIFQIVGATTFKLNKFNKGDFILDFAGPLGEATNYGEVKSVCVIGGGVGCAIAYPHAKHLFSSGVRVDVIAGFRNKDAVILEDEFKTVSDNLYVTTDDGSYQNKGFVTDMLEELLGKGEKYDLIIAVGPIGMMKAVSESTRKHSIKTLVSLNPIMIDATGMCGCCRVNVGGEQKFACVDGPDFDGHEVDFDSLIKRNSYYHEIERQRCEDCGLLGGKKNGR